MRHRFLFDEGMQLSKRTEGCLARFHAARITRFHRRLFPWVLAVAVAVILWAVKVISET